MTEETPDEVSAQFNLADDWDTLTVRLVRALRTALKQRDDAEDDLNRAQKQIRDLLISTNPKDFRDPRY